MSNPESEGYERVIRAARQLSFAVKRFLDCPCDLHTQLLNRSQNHYKETDRAVDKSPAKDIAGRDYVKLDPK
jgi:hypothetical protein